MAGVNDQKDSAFVFDRKNWDDAKEVELYDRNRTDMTGTVDDATHAAIQLNVSQSRQRYGANVPPHHDITLTAVQWLDLKLTSLSVAKRQRDKATALVQLQMASAVVKPETVWPLTITLYNRYAAEYNTLCTNSDDEDDDATPMETS